MTRDLVGAPVTAVIGTLFLGLGVAGIYRRGASAIILAVAGAFLLLSAYYYSGRTIKNPTADKAARVFGVVVASSTIAVLLVAGIAGTILHPRGAVTFLTSAFWLLCMSAAFRNLMLMIKTKKS